MRNKTRPNFLKFGIAGLLTGLALLVVGVIGWVINIIELTHMTNVLSTGEGIVRAIGIFIPPLGAFMGLFF